MSEWIECNMAWRVRLESPQTPPWPDMDAKIKAQFGKDKAHFEEDFFPGYHTDGMRFLSEHPTFQEYERIRDELETNHSEEEVKKLLSESANAAVKTVYMWRAMAKQIDRWVEEQPEWIEACAAHEAAWESHKEAEGKLSFCGQNLNQAGTVIEFEEDGKLSQMMIGTINELGGSCDDCRGINDDSIILRYKVLWNGQESEINT